MKSNTKNIITSVCAVIIAFVFVYTAVSKVYDWEGTRSSLYNQVFPIWVAEVLLYVIPALELIIAYLLLSKQRIGFYLSFVLMTIFTGYVGLVYIGFFDRVPCSCGGVISGLSWGQHLIFNVFLLGVAGIGVWIGKLED